MAKCKLCKGVQSDEKSISCMSCKIKVAYCKKNNMTIDDFVLRILNKETWCVKHQVLGECKFCINDERMLMKNYKRCKCSTLIRKSARMCSTCRGKEIDKKLLKQSKIYTKRSANV